MKEVNGRQSQYEIDDIFLKRFSPRAMSGEIISEVELMTLFEAARWAPSSRNIQPWRFVYAHRDTPEFEKLFSFLGEFNQSWCDKASVLVVTLSKKTEFDNVTFSPTHSFDTGSAWMSLALQASKMNLVAHGMGGINWDMIREKLALPENYAVEMMIAIGKPGKIEDLPEKLREREIPSQRKPLSEIVFKGEFSS